MKSVLSWKPKTKRTVYSQLYKDVKDNSGQESKAILTEMLTGFNSNHRTSLKSQQALLTEGKLKSNLTQVQSEAFTFFLGGLFKSL